MLEKERHALAVVGSPASLGKLFDQSANVPIQAGARTYSRADIDCLNPGAQLLLGLMRHCICDDNLLELATVQSLNSVATEDTVGDNCNCLLGAMLNHDIGSLDESTAGIGHVVHDDGNAITYVAD